MKSIPVHNLSYEQAHYEGTLAWLATTRFQHQGQELELTIVAKRDENGYLSLLHTPVRLLATDEAQPTLS